MVQVPGECNMNVVHIPIQVFQERKLVQELLSGVLMFAITSVDKTGVGLSCRFGISRQGNL